MKILEVSNFFKPMWDRGGVTRSNYEISKNLALKGHEITVFTTDGYNPKLNLPTNKPVYVDGMKVYYFKNSPKKLLKKLNLTFPYYLPMVLRKEIDNYDAIHIHEHRTILAVFVHHYAKKHGIPYVLQPRGSIPTISKNIQKKLFDVLFGKAIVNDANVIIASSRIESDQYKHVFPELDNDKIIYLPNGINLDDYSVLPKRGNFKKKHSINNDAKIILFLSRLHERKGADILIESFYKSKLFSKNVCLVIAGPDAGQLNKLQLTVKNLGIESNVIFPGPLYEESKFEAYIDADVLVLPSKDKYESFGNVVLEALACGTPVIVSENCGVAEWIDSKLCHVISLTDESLQQAITEILSDNQFQKDPARFKNEFLLKKLSWENICENLESIYKEMI